MNRRKFITDVSRSVLIAAAPSAVSGKNLLRAAMIGSDSLLIDPATAKDWHRRWERFILDEARRKRYCDTEMGEELGWLVSPFLDGFYYPRWSPEIRPMVAWGSN